ncbi:LPXTG cell wall anchor domain-containing protein, partial [Streptomyces sp. ISL-99]|uniref:LPXTG cell wall anchor domain-containing protein n=1 Tax=Streptomyces sp. ISL-99 TaxID=2819193 RepID=UPI001BE5923B
PDIPTDPGGNGGNGTGGNGGNGTGGNGGNGNGGNNGNQNGGGGNGGTDDGGSATGGSDGGTDGDAGTCTLDLDGAECEDNTDTDSAGSQPVAQGKAKEELAATGAAQTSFLLIGAATMIAGGIGFRMLPRLVNGRTVA